MCMLNEHVRGLREIFFPRVLEVQAIIFFTEGGGGVQSGLLLVILLYGFYKAGFSSRVLILSLLDPRME